MLTPHRVESPEIAPQQYAVVLVNGDQLDDLMSRPAMRQVNRRLAQQDVYARYERLKRRTAAAAVCLLVLAGGLAWFLAPQPAMASMFPWSGPAQVPAIPTGASFSVTIVSVGSGDAASAAAARVRGFGLPAFTRRSPGASGLFQAMVGPYAALDEAERAQRRLGPLGHRGARLFVDESLRSANQEEIPADLANGNLGVLLVGAPDRLSFVLELPSEPREVKSRRSSESTLDVDVSPLTNPVQHQQWRAPEGVHLMQSVMIDGLTAPGGGQYLRARLTLPEFARTNVRNEGTRVYVDLTWPLEEEDVRAPRRLAPVAEERQEDHEAARVHREDEYRQAIEPVRQRITEIRPFLLSAAQSGSAEVRSALNQTLAEVESSLAAMKPPASELHQHQLLLSGIRTARRGLEPDFTGDRLAHEQQTVAMFDGAMAPSITPTAQ